MSEIQEVFKTQKVIDVVQRLQTVVKVQEIHEDHTVEKEYITNVVERRAGSEFLER